MRSTVTTRMMRFVPQYILISASYRVGNDGAQGNQGNQGNQGKTGTQGVEGNKGDTGASGDTTVIVTPPAPPTQ